MDLLKNQYDRNFNVTFEEIKESIEKAHKEKRNIKFVDYADILIPMIRKTMPELIAEDLVGVQPMNAPAGLVFQIRHNYKGHGVYKQVEVTMSDLEEYLDRLGI